jgi:hypothetical protein
VTVIKRTEKKHVVEVTRTLTFGKQESAHALLLQSRGGTVWNTAFIERINGTFRERLAVLTRRCRHAARRLRALETGMYLVGCTYKPVLSSSRVEQSQASGSSLDACNGGRTH